MGLLVAACAVLWLWALVSLCARRDVEKRRKVRWLVALLVLNAAGALIYFVFGPRPPPKAPDQAIDPDAKPFTPEGESWNPIIGENRFEAGKGLNSKEDPGDLEDERSDPSPSPPR